MFKNVVNWMFIAVHRLQFALFNSAYVVKKCHMGVNFNVIYGFTSSVCSMFSLLRVTG